MKRKKENDDYNVGRRRSELQALSLAQGSPRSASLQRQGPSGAPSRR